MKTPTTLILGIDHNGNWEEISNHYTDLTEKQMKDFGFDHYVKIVLPEKPPAKLTTVLL